MRGGVQPRILVVEDEEVIRSEVRRALAHEGHEVVEASDVSEATRFGLGGFDLIVSDIRLPGGDGDALIDLARSAGGVPVLLMTAYGTVRSAVDAMKRGAADYLTKPFGPDELVAAASRVLAAHRREDVVPTNDSGLLGSSEVMELLRARIGKLAASDARILIVGESGTGKELVARALHDQSPRRQGPFVPVNCAAIPDNLIESELFGHERGAFTGAVAEATGLVETASGGTLFLDEIAELPLVAQARLLRLVQEGEIRRVGSSHTRRVDIRMIAATHRDLWEMVGAGSFREDLYFRLRVLEVRVPPLRERSTDVLELAAHFLEQHCARRGLPSFTFTEAAHRALLGHDWAGNVRELEHAIERAVTLHDGGRIGPELLDLDPQRPRLGGSDDDPHDSSLAAYFRSYVLGHQDFLSETELARRLGISRKSLWERRQRFGIPRSRKPS